MFPLPRGRPGGGRGPVAARSHFGTPRAMTTTSRRSYAACVGRARTRNSGHASSAMTKSRGYGERQRAPYGGIVKIALLTGQRRAKVTRMRWSEISDVGEWTIGSEPREKRNAGVLVLPEAALDAIKAQPHFASNPFVFAGQGNRPFNGMLSKAKRQLDAAAKVDGWTLQRLSQNRALVDGARRGPTGHRRAGTPCTGVEGVYDDWHSYRDEKADA